MTPVQRPLGFTLLAIYLTISVLSRVFPVTAPEPPLQGIAALPLVTAIFAAVAAEALWNCRPWCVRAFIAYCGVRLLGPLAGAFGVGTIEPPEASVSLIMIGFAAVMTGAYVRHRAARLFAPPAVPVPAPHP